MSCAHSDAVIESECEGPHHVLLFMAVIEHALRPPAVAFVHIEGTVGDAAEEDIAGRAGRAIGDIVMPSAMGVALAKEVELRMEIGVKTVFAFPGSDSDGVDSAATEERGSPACVGDDTGLSETYELAVPCPGILNRAEADCIPRMILVLSALALDGDREVFDRSAVNRPFHVGHIDIGSATCFDEGIEDGSIEREGVTVDGGDITMLGNGVLIDCPSFIGV